MRQFIVGQLPIITTIIFDEKRCDAGNMNSIGYNMHLYAGKRAVEGILLSAICLNDLGIDQIGRSRSNITAPDVRISRTTQGFTLLEMLIVLAIIGLLVALVGPRLLERLDTSKVTTTETQIRMLRTALDTFRLDVGRYPTTEEGLDALQTPPADAELRAKWHGPYLEGDLPKDAWGHAFQYTYSGVGNPPFALYSYGPEGKPSDGSNKGIGILPHS